MSAPINIPTRKQYPHIELSCSFCLGSITVPGVSYTSCVGCQNRICQTCAPEMIQKYGNKYRMVSEYYVNNCDECDPDYTSDCDSVYEDSN